MEVIPFMILLIVNLMLELII